MTSLTLDREAPHRSSGLGRLTRRQAVFGLAYAWAGFAVMWGFWISFVVFLSNPSRLAGYWPLPTIDQGVAAVPPTAAFVIDLSLIALFGIQHSLMARPWFKARWAKSIPAPFERCTYVHMANLALFTLVLFWQPIPTQLWKVTDSTLRDVLWAAFAAGWLILFFGATSFGIRDLLGIEQMRTWSNGEPTRPPRLKTGHLYRWLRHPMYVGVLLGVWATPTMSVGHALLAVGFTGYVLIALRHEERDLSKQFGCAYERWRCKIVS